MTAGIIGVGEHLVVRRRSKSDVEGVVTEAGGIRIGRIEYTTPSAAAKAALNVGAVQGWTRWRVPRLDFVTLDELRKQLDV